MTNTATLSSTRQELSNFLTIRRQQLVPADVGLPPGLRRRTPGLRREEVALLANVSPTWYTRLEQGKHIGVSAQVIRGIARALRLSEAEERHLLALAGLPTPKSTELLAKPALELRSVTQQLNPFPAFVIDDRWNLVLWNQTAGRLYQFDHLSPGDRNVLLFLFTNPSQRRRLASWSKEARSAVARFRAATVYAVGEPWFVELTGRLLAESPEFAALWKKYDIRDEHTNTKVLTNASYGRITLQQTTLTPQGSAGLQLIVQSPADVASLQALTTIGQKSPTR